MAAAQARRSVLRDVVEDRRGRTLGARLVQVGVGDQSLDVTLTDAGALGVAFGPVPSALLFVAELGKVKVPHSNGR
jgi:hypothetical protein